MAMLKRLFGSSSELQRLFQQCRVDKTHQLMHTKRILQLCPKIFLPISRGGQNNNVSININIHPSLNNQINISINNHPPITTRKQQPPIKRKELTSLILKKIRSTSDVQRIKGLALAHGIIKKTYDSEFMEVIGEQVENYIFSCEREEGQSRRMDTMERDFIHQNIVSFYCQYLKRFILNTETFRYAEKHINGVRLPLETTNIIQMVSQGFVILNLCNYILQSQYTFNKMGRYYIEHKQVINLFLMYLTDLTVYNSYIKELTRLSLKSIQSATQQEIKHHFLFVTESQKTSDRLYEFFYNRYYYTQVKKLILMPTFLNIHTDQYKQLADYVKKNDPDLLQVVKNSKFAHGRSSSRPKTSLNEVESMATRMNKTELMKEEKDLFSFMSYVQEEHKDLEDLTEVTVKRYTLSKP